jgi:molybdopterin-guanine dinucleotide biosynthesis protein A
MAAMAEFEAVILAGGRAARLAFADKPALEVGGVPMLVSVARAAAEAGAQGIVVVGPDRDGPVHDALVKLAAAMPGGLRVVREQPPSGGPVPALRRGLAEVTAPWLALLAADMPFLTGRQLGSVLARAVRGVGGAVGNAGGAVLTDDEGRPQWLAGCWRSGLLRAAVERYEGSSLHGLLSPLSPALVWPAAAGGVPPPWLDCDNPDDLAVARGLTDRNGELSDHSG